MRGPRIDASDEVTMIPFPSLSRMQVAKVNRRDDSGAGRGPG
jgi:hypothetical protein